MIIVEILLTIWAWNRGWKWYSLLPLGIAVFIGLIAGFSIGTSGGSTNDVGWVVVFDVLATIALIIMISIRKKPIDEEKPKE
jgi:hypothetical protein